MLYLLKSAGTQEYLQENLRILAAPAGDETTIDYDARWVHPDLWGQIRPGEVACLVFGDRPYQRFLPVRQAEVVQVIDEAGDLTVTVRMGAFVAEPAPEAFSPRFSALNEKRYFVARDDAPTLTFVPAETDDREAWKRLLQALLVSPGADRSSPYAQSIFLRCWPLIDKDGTALPEEAELRAGQCYRQPLYCYAPGLTPETLRDHRLVVEPGTDNVEVSDLLPLPADGELVIELRPIEPGPLSLETWTKPDRARSAALTFDYQVVAAPVPDRVMETGPEATPAVLEDRQLRELFKVVQMEQDKVRDEALLGLIDHVLEPLTPDSHYLDEQRALCLYRLERWGEAYQQLDQLDSGLLSPRAVTAWFVSACRDGIDAEFDDILNSFTAWNNTSLVEELIAALPHVHDQHKLVDLTEIICYSTITYQRRVWDLVHTRFTQPAIILEAVHKMVSEQEINLLSPAEGYRYLVERMSDLGIDKLDLLRRAVTLGLEEPGASEGLDETFLDLVKRLLHREDRLEEAWRLVTQAQSQLGTRTWAEATELLADTLAGRPEPEWRANACQLCVDLARVYREQFQDLDGAGDYLKQALMLVEEDSELMPAVEAESDRWEAALERLEAIQHWHEGLQEVRQKRLREHLSGKRAVFVGGRNKGFDAEAVRKELGLAEADFVPHFHSERGSLDKVRDKIRQGKVDYVVDFIALGAHRNLEGDCDSTDVTYVRVRRSRSLHQIVRALASVHGIELE